MLPTHLPLTALDRLVRDHCTLTAEHYDEMTPLEMLIGYLEGGEYGGTPYENPESDETDPLKRLQAGERLVIQLYNGFIEDEASFADGTTYKATDAEIEANEERELPQEAWFPDETGFFGLGLRLEGDRLGLEPVRISGDMRGNTCVDKAQFPPSLMERTVAYLKGVG